MHLIELGFCLFSLLRRRHSLSIPSTCVHRRSGEQVFGTLILAIMHRKRTNKVFGKHSDLHVTAPNLHDGSTSKC